MAEVRTAFGIDFGTTNTRVAHYRSGKVEVVPVAPDQERARAFQVPTLVAYQGEQPVSYGHEALALKRGTLPSQSIKWLLDRQTPVEVDGHLLRPVSIVADFFRHLRQVVLRAVPDEPLTEAALTIPLHYPPRARTNLLEACREAGITVSHFFFEPVAALYCDLVAHPVSGLHFPKKPNSYGRDRLMYVGA
jgi:molecular chaperone DnaK (HSP70)